MLATLYSYELAVAGAPYELVDYNIKVYSNTIHYTSSPPEGTPFWTWTFEKGLKVTFM